MYANGTKVRTTHEIVYDYKIPAGTEGVIVQSREDGSLPYPYSVIFPPHIHTTNNRPAEYGFLLAADEIEPVLDPYATALDEIAAVLKVESETLTPHDLLSRLTKIANIVKSTGRL